MPTWALIGSPNSGKTTLYNWLTGAKSKTVNYPGSTVEYNIGLLRTQLSARIANTQITLIDTPGVYSLTPQSDDEQVTHDVLFSEKKGVPKVDAVLAVLDATQLSRHLLLAKQLIDSGYPILFVITMWDLVEKEGSRVDLDLLKAELGFNVILFDGILGRGLDEIVQSLNIKSVPKTHPYPSCSEDGKIIQEKQQQQVTTINWAETLSRKSFLQGHEKKSLRSFSNKLDTIFLHPVLGFILFFVFMTLLFSAVYWAAAPAMDLIDNFFAVAAAFVTENIPGLAGEFLGSGLIAAIGGVVIFVPQILVLFIAIGLLESTGYLARVAVLIDKPLSLVGLGGRSFVPLLSGFACAIPAIMATRNIVSKKEKLIAQSIIPFMTCSARLPVYALLIGFLYGGTNPLLAGFVMSLMYFGGILVGAIAAYFISILVKDTSKSRLLMELPLYRHPNFAVILLQSIGKAKNFVFKAGPIIFCLAVILWFATHFPRPEVSADSIPSAAEIAQQSYAARLGRFIEPVFTPMGLDWRAGFGLISAFAAREVFVSALALVYNIESVEDEAQTQSLITTMRTASFPDGTLIFTTASVFGILIFFMIALQCTSTVGILRRETGSWTPALMQLLLSNAVAYVLAVSVVAILKNFGY